MHRILIATALAAVMPVLGCGTAGVEASGSALAAADSPSDVDDGAPICASLAEVGTVSDVIADSASDTHAGWVPQLFAGTPGGCESCCGAAGYGLWLLKGLTCYCANKKPFAKNPEDVCSGEAVGICEFNAALPANPPPEKGTPGQHNQVKVTAATWR